ncbi:MAG TPA: helix-turn-helix domain-containing protein [Acidimicrobiales bacterium]|nr:helix-turn-helix domain-containing protein [Acidimicrobiales bacterium]
MQRNLLDLKQAAELLQLPTAQVRRLVDQETIPFVKVGPFVRFDGEELEKWRDRNAKVVLRPEGLTIDLRGTPIYTRNV